jgi:hypothetical protein
LGKLEAGEVVRCQCEVNWRLLLALCDNFCDKIIYCIRNKNS